MKPIEIKKSDIMTILLHAPVLHFHIGAWFVTALCTTLAFWINFLRKRKLLPDRLDEFLGPDVIVKLDYVANITGIVGFFGILIAIYTGFIDAGGPAYPNPFDLNQVRTGILVALHSPLLVFKMEWTAVAITCFVTAGLLRFYFVTLQGDRTIYDENILVQIIFAELIIVGFLLLIVIAAVGGIIVDGGTILQEVPIMNQFLPGGNLLVPFVILAGVFALLLLAGISIKEKEIRSENLTNNSEQQ